MFDIKNNVRLRALLDKYKSYFGILIFLSVLVLIYFLGGFLNGYLGKQQETVKQKKFDLNQEKQTVSDLKNIKDTIPDFPQQVGILDKLVLSKSGVGGKQFLAQIEVIGKKSNVRLNTITLTSQQNNISAEIQVSGKKSDVEDFLVNLENNMLIINVEKIIISNVGTNDISSIISIVTGS